MCGAADNVAALVANCRNRLRASLMAMLHELSTSQTHPTIFNNGLNVCCLPGGPKTSCAGTYAECRCFAMYGARTAVRTLAPHRRANALRCTGCVWVADHRDVV